MLTFLIFALLVTVTTAYPNGARVPPNRAMDSMCTTGNQRPRHTTPDGQVIMPEETDAPFTLTATGPNPYGKQSVFRVTLTGVGRQTFKGFFITADAEDAKFGVKGMFSSLSNNAKTTKFCTPGMTHTNNQPKSTVTVQYKAPANYTHGTLQFKATVVLNFTTFYTGIRSNSFKAIKNANTKTETEYAMSQLSAGGMKPMGGAGGLGGLLGGFDMAGMMRNMMGSMSTNRGGPMMNPRGGLPMTSGRGMPMMPGMGGMGGLGGRMQG